MKKYRCDPRKPFLLAVFLIASPVAFASEPSPQEQGGVDAPGQWPETRHVEEWLAYELRVQSRTNRPDRAPIRALAPARPTGQASASGMEVVALYGVGDTLAADVRMGSRVHAALPVSGARRADKWGDAGGITVEAKQGTCLRLRYRKTSRTACLDLAARTGENHAH